MFWLSLLAMMGTMGCGIEDLSNFAPHLKQMHMLVLWLALRFRNGLGLPILWHNPIIHNVQSHQQWVAMCGRMLL